MTVTRRLRGGAKISIGLVMFRMLLFPCCPSTASACNTQPAERIRKLYKYATGTFKLRRSERSYRASCDLNAGLESARLIL